MKKKKALLHGRCPMTLARTHADIKQRKIGETVENFADETERSAPKRSLQQVYALLLALGIAVSRTGSSSASAGGTYSSFAFVFFSLSVLFLVSRVSHKPLHFLLLHIAASREMADRNNYQLVMKSGYSSKNNNSDDDDVLLVV